MGGGGERAEETLEDGAQAVGSGEPLDRSHFPPLLQSSLASPLFCCQTCVQAQRAKPGASKVIFFSPSIFSLSAQTLLFFLLSRQTTQTVFPRGWGAHLEQLAPLSGSHSLIWQPILALGSQHLSGEEGWDSSCPCCAVEGGYQSGHPLTWPSPIR